MYPGSSEKSDGSDEKLCWSGVEGWQPGTWAGRPGLPVVCRSRYDCGGKEEVGTTKVRGRA